MRIIGYGICGPGEAKRYLRQTLEEFKRLCDDVVICLNHAGPAERAMIEEYGYNIVEDDREWGKYQWLIKEDLLRTHVAVLSPDWCIALDMDERFDSTLTRRSLEELMSRGHSGYHTFVIDLWDDGYAPDRSFWKVQMFKWNGDVEFAKKSLHCGLVPFWAGTTAAYAPYVMLHYGLKDKKERLRRVERYKKYDPHAKLIAKEYYDALANGQRVIPFDEKVVHKLVADEVASYTQEIKRFMPIKKEKYVFLKRLSDGKILDMPEYLVNETLRRGGFEIFEEKKPEVVETPPEATLKCDCGFPARSEFGLKSHMRIKHGSDSNK